MTALGFSAVLCLGNRFPTLGKTLVLEGPSRWVIAEPGWRTREG
jgi:hypothetical protein